MAHYGAFPDEDLSRIRSIALESEEVAGRLVSLDGRVAGLVASVALPESRELAKVEVTDFLFDTAEAARQEYSTFDYHLTGDVILNRAMRDALDEDLGLLGPAALGTMLLVAVLILRSARVTRVPACAKERQKW